MTEEEAKQESQNRERQAAEYIRQPEAFHKWLEYSADMLYRVVIGVPGGDQDERNAALVAIQAMRWIAAPPKEIRIVKAKEPITIADGQGGSIRFGKPIEQQQQREARSDDQQAP